VFVCSFFVRAGRFKRPLGGDQEGSQLRFVFLPIGPSSFLDPLVLVCTPRFS